MTADTTRAAADRRRWASRRIALGGRDLPAYGSTAWSLLPDEDPRRYIAAIRAAEAWALEGEDLPQRLEAELAALRAWDAADWRRFIEAAGGPPRRRPQTLAERVAEARTPRPGDYLGAGR